MVDVCYALGRACASTGMIYAMHQIMVACLVRHARGSAWHRDLLRRMCEEQMLLASSTTDGQGGGDLRKSDCAVEQNDARFTLVKSATVMSYGAQADGIVTTARRTPDAPATDQVLVALCKGDYRLDHLVDWDTLGMRGTCSAGFTLKAARRHRADLSRAVSQDPFPDRDAGRPSHLGRGMGRYRGRRGRSRPRLHPQGARASPAASCRPARPI